MGNEISGFDICRCKLRTKQVLLLTTELKLNDGKDNSRRIIHANMNTSNFIRSWLNFYKILNGRADANATIFVFN